MFYHYKFWHSLMHPTSFTGMIDQGKIIGYKRRSFLIFLLFILLFATREFWGMGTENLTSLFATGLQDDYTIARILSMIGAILWAVLYFCFHYYGVSFILSIFTEIPYKWIQKVQLYVLVFILIEKTILFSIFYSVGYTTFFSFFSLAPLAQQFIDEGVFLFSINQITVATVLTIIVQYTFLSKWEEESDRKSLLAKIIILQVLMAVFVGMFSMLPIETWLARGLG